MEELMIKIDNVTKQYKLGQIGGTTLRDELQRLNARLRHKEDPTKRIGAKDYNKGETFMALNGVSFEVRKGERVGIIGHNGAGKSTLLKLLSRVTAPTSGEIGLNGRVASMLEVGTGFHGELTGRENIYMNGAILGMTKKEIDAKIEDIIEFSECRQFIDTPVKRYSSGMYVKLAFSVAAHLDSEIMIMDEVLAVGDMAFQKKCLDKMNDVSRSDGRTILYVSHNMNTIRQLCDRVVVLDHGKVVFNGGVEEGIRLYFGINNTSGSVLKLDEIERSPGFRNCPARMTLLKVNTKDSVFEMNSKLSANLAVRCKEEYHDVIIKAILSHNDITVATMESPPEVCLFSDREASVSFVMDLSSLAPSDYSIKFILFRRNNMGGVTYLDVLENCYYFKINESNDFQNNQKWNTKYNGFLVGKQIVLKTEGSVD